MNMKSLQCLISLCFFRRGKTEFKTVSRAGRKNHLSNLQQRINNPTRTTHIGPILEGYIWNSRLLKTQAWRPDRLIVSPTNPRVNIGRHYLSDIKFKSNAVETVQIRTASYADADKFGNLICSYSSQNISYTCAIQHSSGHLTLLYQS